MSTVEAIAKSSGDPRFAWDCYRRFIQMYSNVVLDIEHHNFEEILELYKDQKGYRRTPTSRRRLAQIVVGYKEVVKRETGKAFPQDAREQLWGAIGAVFSSWMNQRAITYRRLHEIPESWGTAVNVQAMVFGNMGETSATGVAFTRNPVDRRKRALRRIPDQRPGRGRGRGHPHPAKHHGSRAHRRQLRQALDGSGDAGGFRRIRPRHATAGKALPRHAGHGIHRRARQVLDAADPQRQAHRASRLARRRGNGQ